MSLNAYLQRTANLAILGNDERDSITRSIAFMERKLKDHFGTDIIDQKLFGSYTRGTILPRYMDAESDIDYMVVFRDGSLRPQSYLDRLRRFVEVTYTRSEIRQSSPTIQLELNHIRFELVPAIQHFWGSLQIPNKSSQNQGWMDTDPQWIQPDYYGCKPS
jgi:predicted nucleotidyltransferase